MKEDRTGKRCFWQELFGMCFYCSEEIGYFYAYSSKAAMKKAPTGNLYVVNQYGENCPVNRD